MTSRAAAAAPLLLSLRSEDTFAAKLAIELQGDSAPIVVHHFPDGETCVRIDIDVARRDVIIVANLRSPDAATLPLLFLADAARDLGADRVGLVAPYLAYMRQDTRFHPGESITSRTYAALLSAHVDWLVTVDPHLHRYHALEALYTIPAIAAHAGQRLGCWIAANVDAPLVIGPDDESRQWAEAIACVARAPALILSKTRRGDSDVRESALDLRPFTGRTPVVVDDIISTGQTMIAAVRQLFEHRLAPICVGVHAVFAEGAHQALLAAGARRAITTNTIPHPTNGIDVTEPIARAVRDLLRTAAPKCARAK